MCNTLVAFVRTHIKARNVQTTFYICIYMVFMLLEKQEMSKVLTATRDIKI